MARLFFLDALDGLPPRQLSPLEREATDWLADHPRTIQNRAEMWSDCGTADRGDLPPDPFDEQLGWGEFAALQKRFPYLCPDDYWLMPAHEWGFLRAIVERERLVDVVNQYLEYKERRQKALASGTPADQLPTA